jgi:hypothetical protein
MGQLINPSKCSIMFDNGCLQPDRNKVQEILGVGVAVVDEKYLGMPTPEGRITKDKFKTTKERMVRKLTNWVERNMSAGAKEVLIKSVAQAIPVYVMGIFKLPRTLCEEMTQLIRYFWWGDEEGQRKIHWTAWDKFLLPKSYGGMGFRDLRLFNQALLVRQAWRLLQYPESLCAQLLRASIILGGLD